MIPLVVLYPNKSDAKFDFNYYIATHTPPVKKRMEPFGLVRAEVDRGVPGPAPDSPTPFVATPLCMFKSLDGFQKRFASHAQELVADIPNFTNI